MRFRARLGICLLSLGLATPVFAQQEQPADVGTRIMLAANPCATAPDTGIAPQTVIDMCNTALGDMQKLKDASTLNPHQLNLFYVMSAMAHSTIGSKMGEIDKSRSARTCTELEASWALLSKLIPGNSPPNYASDMYSMQQQAVAPVKLCRSEFGTPAGAPRLPPGQQ